MVTVYIICWYIFKKKKLLSNSGNVCVHVAIIVYMHVVVLCICLTGKDKLRASTALNISLR